MLFQAYSTSAEVLGSNIRMYINGMGSFELMGKTILRANGIDEEPKPDAWYNHQMFLNVVKEISAKTGPHTINLIGSRIAENAKFPGQVDSLEKALDHLEEAYRVNHRGDNKSFKRSTLIEEHHYKVTVESPYPCDLDIGYLKGLANRFGIKAAVTHESTQPCRKNGSECCTYIIKW
jgi:hypothetical protein